MRPPVPPDPQSVMRWSRWASDLCLVMATLFVGLSLYRWLSLTPQGLQAELGVAAVRLDGLRRAALLAPTVLPVALIAAGLLRLRKSFRCFARGDLFTPDAVGGLRNFAAAAAGSVLFAAVAWPAVGWILTFDTPAGGDLTVNIGTGSLTILLISVLTWIFAHILGLGAALAEQNASLAAENAAFV